MIQLGYSLLHLLDSESARRGLTRAEMIECFTRAIVENFKRRGKIVSVTVDDSEGNAVICAVETVLTGGTQAHYRDVLLIPPFSPELLTECIEDYIAGRLEATPWLLSETRVRSRADDHYLVEVVKPQYAGGLLGLGDKGQRFHGQLAVLPMKSVAKRDSFKAGDSVWAVVKDNVRTNIDGGYAEEWRNVQAPLIASRTECEFLGRMAMQMVNETVRALIHTDRGILIFPPGQDLSALLADNGRYKNMLQRLTGLERLAVARQPTTAVTHRRLIHAIREVAGLAYQTDYKLGCEDPAKLPVIYIRPQHVKRLVGAGGHNLYFIKQVCGFGFEFKVSYNMSPGAPTVRGQGTAPGSEQGVEQGSGAAPANASVSLDSLEHPEQAEHADAA